MDPEDGDDFDDIEDFDDQEGEQPDDQQSEETEGEDVEEPQLERKPSRAQARIEALDREAKAARERAEAAERQLQEIQSGRQRSDAEAQAERRRQELAQMDPWDRAQAEARDSEARINHRLGAVQRQLEDSNDRAEFAAACVANPALAKVKDEVETQLKDARSRGVDVPRKTLAAYILGNQLLEKAPKARARAEKRAAANLDRERGRPAAGASEAPRSSGGKDEKAARNARLENYTF